MSAATSPAIISTDLYPFVPTGVGTCLCECLDSLLRRLAVAHTVTYPALMKHICETSSSSMFPFWYSSEDFRRSLLFNSQLIPSIAEATGRDEVKLCTLQTLNSLINFYRCMDVTMNRHCPVCVAEHPFPRAWYPIIWCIGPVEACPVHHVQLVSSQCGYGRDRWLPVVKRCSVPGVCHYCGSIGFQCLKPSIKYATDLQIWVADQVGAIVAAATRGEAFDALAMKASLRKIAISQWGSIAAAVRFLEVDEWRFRDGLKPRTRFGLQFLLALCSSAGADILDVLRGGAALASTTGEAYRVHGQWMVKTRTRGVTKDEVESLVSSDSTLTIKELTARAGVSHTWFREHFPREYAHVAGRYRELKRKSGWRRLLATGRILREAAYYLEQIGLTFNKDNVERYFGLSIWWHKDEELYERIRAKSESDKPK